MSSIKWIFLVDCNSFFASCEQLFNPALLGKPVVVLSNNEGCIIARSKEAKKLGIPMGAPVYQWSAFFREKRVFSFAANFSLYSDMSRRVMEVLAQFSPELEEYSIDEAFLQIQCPNPLEKAMEIRERVEKWTGIPVAVGIGMTKTLAKLASDLAKSNGGTFLIDPRDPQLSKVDVQEVWGIGARLADHLRKFGICSVLDFIQCDPLWIKKQFSVNVERTLLELQGEPCLAFEEFESPNQSILCSRSFKVAVEDFEILRAHLANHTARAAGKLRKQESLCCALTVFSHLAGRTHSLSATCELPLPTDYTPRLIAYASKCLEKFYLPGHRYKKLGVLFSGIVPKENQVEDLFAESAQQLEKKARAMLLLDTARVRFGKKALRLASQTEELPSKRPRYTTSWDELMTIETRA